MAFECIDDGSTERLFKAPPIWTLPAITLGSIALSIPLTMNPLWN